METFIVHFKNTSISVTAANLQEAVSSLLCSYCTVDWTYTNDGKVTMIEKYLFPEHKCQNKLQPCGFWNRIRYYKSYDF